MYQTVFVSTHREFITRGLRILVLGFQVVFESLRYLPGSILIQAFSPCTSTETRLLVKKEDCEKEEEYDNVAYEERLMHHNTVFL